MINNSIFLTGATGFIGSHLLEELIVKNYNINCLVRKRSNALPKEVEQINIHKFCESPKNHIKSNDVRTFIHVAGLTPSKTKGLSPDDYYEANVELTKKLANAAVKLGVRRFIFISSIGVCGAETKVAFTENSKPKPIDDYSKSKLKAEKLLEEISASTNMEVVIVRPPLVYGPNAPGNFGALLKLVSLGIPLPVGSLNNKKTLCGVNSLIDFIMTCIVYENSLNDTFLIGDAESVSTKELVQYIGEGIKRPVKSFPVPIPFLNALGILTGKKKVINKLSSSLEIDISKATRKLNWKPSVSARKGIAHAAEKSVQPRSQS